MLDGIGISNLLNSEIVTCSFDLSTLLQTET